MTPQSYPKIDIPAVTLSYVCRAWRDIVTANPSLWSTFFLDIDHIPDAVSSAKVVSATQHMLDASRDHPLDVEMCVDVDGWLHPAVLLLLSQCRRWVRARLHFENTDVLDSEKLKGIEGNLLQLELVSIELAQEFSSEIQLFAVAPRLRHVFLNNVDIPHVLLPWPQIRTFGCGQSYIKEIYDSLRVGKHLREVEITTPTVDQSLTLWHPEQPLYSDLKELSVQFKHEETRHTELLLSALH